MRLPQDIANILAITVRDVIWFKPAVAGFFKDCKIPEPVLGEVLGMLKTTATVKVVHHLLDRLDVSGDKGTPAIQLMLTKIYRWKDLHSVPLDRKDIASTSLREFQAAYQKHEAQREYQREQEKRMHHEREKRIEATKLDHSKLQAFRDEFDSIHSINDMAERGNRFQDLMNKIFGYYSEKSLGPFNRTGEQVDGLFYFDKHWYYVEIRWKATKANAADVSVLRDRAKDAFGGDTKALFISFNGFSPDCLESLAGRSDERVVLMDGVDLRDVLDCAIAFDVLLGEKQADVVRNKRAFVGAREIIQMRRER